MDGVSRRNPRGCGGARLLHRQARRNADDEDPARHGPDVPADRARCGGPRVVSRRADRRGATPPRRVEAVVAATTRLATPLLDRGAHTLTRTSMLQKSPMYAYIPVADLARARQFYEQKLGVKDWREDGRGGSYEFR